jgi:hypothetical protein
MAPPNPPSVSVSDDSKNDNAAITITKSFSTMQTGCLTGGIKKRSGVNVLPEVAQTWARVRDDADEEVNWFIAGYVTGSKTDITVIHQGAGTGGNIDSVGECQSHLLLETPAFGGLRLADNNRFVQFFWGGHADHASAMLRGRASLHKNGVLNVLEGCDREITLDPMGMGAGGDSTAEIINTNNVKKPTVTPQRAPATSDSIWQPHQSPQIASKSLAEALTDESEQRIQPQQSESHLQSQPKLTNIFSYDQLLTGGNGMLPSYVNASRKEMYLSDIEFAHLFDGMDKDTFAALPKWKQTKSKKALGLF